MPLLPLAFITGFLAAGASLLVEVSLSVLAPSFSLSAPPAFALIIFALIEESFKIALFFRFGQLVSIPEQSWTVICAFAGGFFGAELAVIGMSAGFAEVAHMPLLGLAGLHVLTSTAIALWLWPQRHSRLQLLLGAATLGMLHALYNILVARL